MLAFHAAPVVGDSSGSRWGEVVIAPLGCAVIELSGQQARERGVVFLKTIQEYLSGSPKTPASFASVPHAPKEIEIETLLLLRTEGDVITVVLEGQGSVYLKRGSRVSRLMYRSGTTSGTIQTGDQIFLGSKGCIEKFSEGEIYHFFDHMTPEKIAEKCAVSLHTRGNTQGASGLFIGFTTLRAMRPVVRWKLLLTIVLVGGFLISIGLGITRQIAVNQNKETVERIASGERLFDEGVSLLELNAVKSRERLTEAKQMLEPLVKTVNPRTIEGRKLTELYGKINDNLTLARRSAQVNPELFYDVSLLKSNSTITSLGIAGEMMALVDTQTHTLFALSLVSKQGAIVGGGEAFGDAIFVDIFGDDLFTFTGRGIQKTGASARATKNIISKDKEWGTIGSMTSFGGNIYLLDTGKSRIWKYIAADNGQFSDRQQYLNPDEFPDLSGGTSLAIDGSVWVGTNSGSVLRFTQGKEQTFLPQGVDPALGTHLAVYTSDDTTHLYVLDSDNNRVVVLDKEGVYLAQYLWEDNGFVPTQLAVSETRKKIFLLASGKLYSIDVH